MSSFSWSRRDALKLGVVGSVTTLVPYVDAKQSGTIRQISYGETREGRIDEQNPTSEFERRDYYVDPIEFEGSAGDEITIQLASDSFVPYLRLIDPDGTTVTTGGDGHDDFAEINTVLEQTGTHRINVTTDNVRATGEYTLYLLRVVQDLRSISYGEIKGGRIDADDPVSGFYRDEQYYIEPVTFRGRTGDEITIEMYDVGAMYGSPAIRLIDPDGNSLDTDVGSYSRAATISTTLQDDVLC